MDRPVKGQAKDEGAGEVLMPVTPETADSKARCLVVVRRDRPDALTRLQERFRDDPGVRVVQDRRLGDRRGSWPTLGYPSQRRGERRRPRMWTPVGFLVLRERGAEPIPAVTVEGLEAALQRVLAAER